MKMKTSAKIHYDSGPNMTPLVDIVMVILIFLMLTGTFAAGTHYLRANMPVVGEKGGPVTEKIFGDKVEINIHVEPSSPDTVFCRIGAAKPITSQEDLVNALRGLRQNFIQNQGKKDENIQVIIFPHRMVSHGSLMKVFSAALGADLKKVAFGTSH